MHALAETALLTLLATSTATDVSCRRIPNVITLTGAAVALALAVHTDGIAGLSQSVFGLLLGLALLLPLYWLGLFGGGDAKLVAAIGAFVGPAGVVAVLMGSALAGGAIALVLAARRGLLGRLVLNLKALAFDVWMGAAGATVGIGGLHTIGSMPYAPCLALGCLWWLYAAHPP